MKNPIELFTQLEKLLLNYNTVPVSEEEFDQLNPASNHLYLCFMRYKHPTFSRYPLDHFYIKTKQLINGELYETSHKIGNIPRNLQKDEIGYDPTALEIQEMFYLVQTPNTSTMTLEKKIYQSLYYLFLSSDSSDSNDEQENACIQKTVEVLENCQGKSYNEAVIEINQLLSFYDAHQSLKYYHENPNDNFKKALKSITAVIVALTAVAGIACLIGMLTPIIGLGIGLGIVGAILTAFLSTFLIAKINNALGIHEFKDFKNFLSFEKLKYQSEPDYVSLTNTYLNFFKKVEAPETPCSFSEIMEAQKTTRV